jgi:NADH:ubiquinone oxidoreductase subunit 6 (subunit J)
MLSSWLFVLPLLAGAAAIYLLLPRPKAYPVLGGALLGVAALVLAGWLIVGFGALTPESFLFYVFSATALGFGALLVTQRNPARAALSFALVVLSTCGLFLLLAAPFLMAATIIIYAGAVIVTFLFVLMLAQQEGPSDADARSREPMLATTIGFVLLGALLYVLALADDSRSPDAAAAELDALLQKTRDAETKDDPDDIRQIVGFFDGKTYQRDLIFQQYKDVLTKVHAEELSNSIEPEFQNKGLSFVDADLSKMRQMLADLEKIGVEAKKGLHGRLRPASSDALSSFSGPPPNTPPDQMRSDAAGLPALPADNPAALGRSLFTDYLLPVELGGFLLLAAAIGAIAIAHRRITPEGP